jgi:hypothetical protein
MNKVKLKTEEIKLLINVSLKGTAYYNTEYIKLMKLDSAVAHLRDMGLIIEEGVRVQTSALKITKAGINVLKELKAMFDETEERAKPFKDQLMQIYGDWMKVVEEHEFILNDAKRD